MVYEADADVRPGINSLRERNVYDKKYIYENIMLLAYSLAFFIAKTNLTESSWMTSERYANLAEELFPFNPLVYQLKAGIYGRLGQSEKQELNTTYASVVQGLYEEG